MAAASRCLSGGFKCGRTNNAFLETYSPLENVAPPLLVTDSRRGSRRAIRGPIAENRRAGTRLYKCLTVGYESRENVELTASAENAAQAEDHAAGARAILFATEHGLRVDPVRTNSGAYDAGFRPAADVLLEPGQRVRLHAVQGDQGPDEVWTQRGREERLLALREGKGRTVEKEGRFPSHAMVADVEHNSQSRRIV